MKIHRHVLFGLVAGFSAFAVSSCAYDPYYSSSSSYGGYGDGYGYGGSNFSTSFFVSTGNSRWAYDPYAGAYYDYTRRAYYDPYLYGYYPVGYRPRYVHGAPHPRGWSRGSNYCAPPSTIRSYNLTNYRDRGERYQNLGRDWSHNVRVNEPVRNQGHSSGGWNRGQSNDGRDQRGSYDSRSGSQGSVFRNRNDSRSRESVPQRAGESPFRQAPQGNDARSQRGSSDRGERSGGSPFGRGNTSISIPESPFSGGREIRPESMPDRPRRAPAAEPPRMERPVERREAPPQFERGGDRGGDRSRGSDSGGSERGRGRELRSLGEG